jgi:hypothetical protein
MQYTLKLSSEALGLVFGALLNLSQSEKRDALLQSLIQQAVKQYEPQVRARKMED